MNAAGGNATVAGISKEQLKALEQEVRPRDRDGARRGSL